MTCQPVPVCLPLRRDLGQGHGHVTHLSDGRSSRAAETAQRCYRTAHESQTRGEAMCWGGGRSAAPPPAGLHPVRSLFPTPACREQKCHPRDCRRSVTEGARAGPRATQATQTGEDKPRPFHALRYQSPDKRPGPTPCVSISSFGKKNAARGACGVSGAH